MKKAIKIILLFTYSCFLLVSNITGQVFNAEAIPINNSCGLSKNNMDIVYSSVAHNMDSLAKRNKLARPSSGSNSLSNYTVMFDWPLRARDAEEFPYFYITNYVDLDERPDEILDYNSGSRTYDSHNGCDIIVGPYKWQRKNDGDIYVIAAAHGIIVNKGTNMQPDDNCDVDNYAGTSAYGNFVVLLHDDNSTLTYYAHMKKGSLTTKSVGDIVATGEYLGVVASSGRSTAPHLHFEVHRNADISNNYFGTLVEPFSNNQNLTQWKSQKPYNDPAILGIETYSATPDWYSNICDQTISSLNKTQLFMPGNTVFTRTFFRDIFIPNNNPVFTFFRPDNTIAATNNGNFQGIFQYVTYNYALPANAPLGVWRYEIQFAGRTYIGFFTVGCTANISITGIQTGHAGKIASGSIKSTASISGSNANYIEYRADNYVQLLPGFTAVAGCYFKADTKGCNTGN